MLRLAQATSMDTSQALSEYYVLKQQDLEECDEQDPILPYLRVLLPGGDAWDQAEALYYGAISRKFSFKEACLMAKALNKQDPDAGFYLKWLIERGQSIPWPQVKAC